MARTVQSDPVGTGGRDAVSQPPSRPSLKFLANRATVETIRNAVYFTDDQHLQPILVEAAWIVGVLVLLLVAARRRGRTPGTG